MKVNRDSVLCTRCGVTLLPACDSPHGGVPDTIYSAKLTPSESAVLLLLCNGLSNKLIADRLLISDNTVRFHLKRLYRKLGVRTRAHAVARGGGASLHWPVVA